MIPECRVNRLDQSISPNFTFLDFADRTLVWNTKAFFLIANRTACKASFICPSQSNNSACTATSSLQLTQVSLPILEGIPSQNASSFSTASCQNVDLFESGASNCISPLSSSTKMWVSL